MVCTESESARIAARGIPEQITSRFWESRCESYLYEQRARLSDLSLRSWLLNEFVEKRIKFPTPNPTTSPPLRNNKTSMLIFCWSYNGTILLERARACLETRTALFVCGIKSIPDVTCLRVKTQSESLTMLSPNRSPRCFGVWLLFPLVSVSCFEEYLERE